MSGYFSADTGLEWLMGIRGGTFMAVISNTLFDKGFGSMLYYVEEAILSHALWAFVHLVHPESEALLAASHPGQQSP